VIPNSDEVVEDTSQESPGAKKKHK
jgi:hypothetical protein